MRDSTEVVKVLLEQTGEKKPQSVKRSFLLGKLTPEQKRVKLWDEEEDE